MSRPTPRVLAISSGGGHWVQLNRLLPALHGYEIVFATVNRAYRDSVGPHRFYALPDATRWDRLRLLLACLRILWILVWERPDVVLTTGAAHGYVAIRLARFFRARTIWVDSVANVEQLSLSGQMARKHADLCLTQWPHLAVPGGPLYGGSVL